PTINIHIPVKRYVEYKIDEFINKNELYDELIKTVIILLKGEAVFPLRCVSICPLLQQINQP
ncbi:TPA: hypothetical protein ACG6BV_001604, partial [Escherichia coli]